MHKGIICTCIIPVVHFAVWALRNCSVTSRTSTLTQAMSGQRRTWAFAGHQLHTLRLPRYYRSLRANARTVPQMRAYSFLPYLFNFIAHQVSDCSTLHILTYGFFNHNVDKYLNQKAITRNINVCQFSPLLIAFRNSPLKISNYLQFSRFHICCTPFSGVYFYYFYSRH
jgi:hypothetical protein